MKNWFKVFLFIFLFFLKNQGHLFSQNEFPSTKAYRLNSFLEKETNLSLPTEKDSVFFFGELHNYKYVDEAAFKAFLNLTASHKINAYCFEGGKSTEFLFYHYLKYGNFKTEKRLADDINVLRNSFVTNFFVPLSDFLKQGSFVRFKCYDIETDLYNSLSVINHILYNSINKKLFEEITNEICVPAIIKSKRYKQCRSVINTFKKDTLRFYSNLTPLEYYYIKEIVTGIKPGIVFDSLYTDKKYSEALNYREGFISINIKKVLERYHSGFLQIGIDHLLVNEGERLNEIFNDFILSVSDVSYKKIGCIYSEIKAEENFWLLDKTDIKEISKKVKARYTMFDVQNLKKEYNTSFDYVLFCK